MTFDTIMQYAEYPLIILGLWVLFKKIVSKTVQATLDSVARLSMRSRVKRAKKLRSEWRTLRRLNSSDKELKLFIGQAILMSAMLVIVFIYTVTFLPLNDSDPIKSTISVISIFGIFGTSIFAIGSFAETLRKLRKPEKNIENLRIRISSLKNP